MYEGGAAILIIIVVLGAFLVWTKRKNEEDRNDKEE